METTILTVFAVIVACSMLPFFLLPAYFGFKEKHPNKWPILIVNISLLVVFIMGWITSSLQIGVTGALLGYMGCLAWSLKRGKAHNESPRNDNAESTRD